MTQKTDSSRIVLVTAHFEEHWLERLQDLSPDLHIELRPTNSDKAIDDDMWQDVEILYTSFATILPAPEKVPNLRWIQLYSAGADRITSNPLFQTSVIFTSASGVHAINMAEHVLCMVLAWFHRLPQILEQQQRAQWPPNSLRSTLYVAEELRGKTMGIVGYGSIGRQIARLANAFGMRVLAMQRGTDHRYHGFQFPEIGDPEGILPNRYYTADQLHIMLNESDVVVVAVPLTTKTRELFDDSAFQAMKPATFLVNIARGEVCKEASLIRALAEKQIAGAALDVFHQEPLPANHPLWYLPNVFITPHSAGLSPLYNERAAMIFVENLRRYLANQSLYNVVDKTLGY